MWAALSTTLNARSLATLAAIAAILAMPALGVASDRGKGKDEKSSRESPPAEDSPKDGRGHDDTGSSEGETADSGGQPAPRPSAKPADGESDGSAPEKRPRSEKAPDKKSEAPPAEQPVQSTGGAPADNATEPVPVTSTAGGTAAPAGTQAPATIAGTAGRRAETARPRRGRERRATSRVLPVLTAQPLAPSAPAPTAAPVEEATDAAPASKRRTGRAKRKRSIPSRIGATVTRLVEVTPDWVIAVLGGLGALTLLLAALSSVTGLRARRVERQRRRLADDIGLLQSALLPVLPPRVGSAFVSAAYRPADGPAAGGDFYDAFALPGGRTAVVVGDVEGHGRRALPLTALVRYTVRAHLESGLEPRLALQAADTALFKQLRGRLVTVVAAVYEPLTGYLSYACAGHPQPVLVGDPLEPVFGAASPPIGAGASTGRRQVTVALPPGAAACFYTDGLPTVRVSEGAAERLGFEAFADHVRALGPEVAAEDVVRSLAPRGGFGDDVTACVLRPLPGAAAPNPVHVEQLEVRGPEVTAARAFLEECGVPADDAEATIREAQRIITRTGAAILEALRTPDGTTATATVRPTEFVALSVRARRGHDGGPAIAAG